MKADNKETRRYLVGVISDTHGTLPQAARQALQGSDLIIHAGDLHTPKILSQLEQIAPVKAVRGNMDRGNEIRQLPASEVVQVGDIHIYVLHNLEDLDIVEIHDAFAPSELQGYEEVGLCGDGEGSRLIEEGKTEIGGEIPVNTSGGLASKGHPVGATGLAQIAEVVWQLRGEAGERQVPGRNKRLGPVLGLTHNGGGTMEGDAATMAVHILKRT